MGSPWDLEGPREAAADPGLCSAPEEYWRGWWSDHRPAAIASAGSTRSGRAQEAARDDAGPAGTLREPFACSENGCQELLGRRRSVSLIKPPADNVVEFRGRLPREIPETTHVAALALRAIVARTRSATSSPIR